MHECLNLIAEPDGVPGCVLIRSVEGVSGPGRLTRHFGITRALNGVPVFDPGGPILVRDAGWRPASISTTPRIGIRRCADWPMRFVADRLIRSS
jgi:DNA-3-methyladenine glycosylase